MPTQTLDRPWHTLSGEDVAAALGVDPAVGLSTSEAAARVAREQCDARAFGQVGRPEADVVQATGGHGIGA